jgi:hypothetical protein
MVQATEQYWKAQVEELKLELVRAKAQLLVLQKALDSVQVSESDLRLQLRRQMAKEQGLAPKWRSVTE